MTPQTIDGHALVGFRRTLSKDEVTKNVTMFPGFRNVKYVFRSVPAALIEINEGSYDTFEKAFNLAAPNSDVYEYCEPDYVAHPFSYVDHVIPTFSARSQLKDNVFSNHGIVRDRNAGRGVRIAIVDSGIAPHPYLPATSFRECAEFKHRWPLYLRQTRRGQQYLDKLEALDKAGKGLESHAPENEQTTFVTSALNTLGDLGNALDEEWCEALQRWYQAVRPNVALPTAGHLLSTPGPLPPWSDYLCGEMRRVSPLSKNVLDDDLHLEDTIGHGTQMTGLLFSWPDLPEVFDDPQQQRSAARFAIPVYGIAPAAELVVVKCYDVSDKPYAFANISVGLDYIQNNVPDVDVVYVGWGFPPHSLGAARQAAKGVLTLGKVLFTLRNKDVVVVCPAGNDENRVARGGLDIPASSDDVLAVASCDHFPKDRWSRDRYSKYASIRDGEQVFLSAIASGDAGFAATTDLSCGFSCEEGTSVAAAIVAGLAARVVGRHRQVTRDTSYDALLHSIAGAPTFTDPARSSLAVKRLSWHDVVETLKRQADTKQLVGEPLPHEEFGFGVARDI